MTRTEIDAPFTSIEEERDFWKSEALKFERKAASLMLCGVDRRRLLLREISALCRDLRLKSSEALDEYEASRG